MQRCLQLAQLGAGSVSPNPMVGAILVHDGRIIGEGYHQQYVQAHAEVNCTADVKEADLALISESTLYVSLEPCSHFGKTPPCVDLIIVKKIPRVVIGCKDPFHEVDGKGIAKLRDAGIEVMTGILEKESIELNKRFFTFHQKKHPYIILKWAQTADKKIASDDDERLLISNEITNSLVHKWRSEEDAVMVGSNTALKDDPALTTRLWPGKNPVRVIIGSKDKLPGTLKLFDGSAQKLVFDEEQNKDQLPKIMTALYEQNIQSILVEGGAKLLQSFIDQHLWDEARVITNTRLTVGNGLDAPLLNASQLTHSENVETDRIDYYLPNQFHTL